MAHSRRWRAATVVGATADALRTGWTRERPGAARARRSCSGEGVTPHPSIGLFVRDLFARHLEDDSVADLDGVVSEPFVEPAQ
jgi:hypothetical protein